MLDQGSQHINGDKGQVTDLGALFQVIGFNSRKVPLKCSQKCGQRADTFDVELKSHNFHG